MYLTSLVSSDYLSSEESARYKVQLTQQSGSPVGGGGVVVVVAIYTARAAPAQHENDAHLHPAMQFLPKA